MLTGARRSNVGFMTRRTPGPAFSIRADGARRGGTPCNVATALPWNEPGAPGVISFAHNAVWPPSGDCEAHAYTAVLRGLAY